MSKISLRALRVNYNLSAKQVASDLKIHHQTLLKYENDSSGIPINLLQAWAKYYHVSLDNIFLGKKYDLKRI